MSPYSSAHSWEHFEDCLGLYDDEELQTYVMDLGARLAATSERPSLNWTFRVVDDATVNAFALPGGYIYVTRGILAHLNSEAELCSVLGHEIGHVTARHGVNQMSKAQLAQIGLGVGSILAPEAAQSLGSLAQTGLSLMFLKFSRDDERQADDLGLRYASRTGYDPRETPHVYEMLERVSAAQQTEGRLPGWLSTHPTPENRRTLMFAKIGTLGPDFSNTRVARKGYLTAIDGTIFGDDPRDGYFVDGRFFHPRMQFVMDFPRGWNTANGRLAVTSITEQRDALVQLTLARSGSPEDALRQFFGIEGIQAGRTWRDRIGGVPCASSTFLVDTQQGPLVGLIAFLTHEGAVLQLLGFTGRDDWDRYDEAIATSLASFGRLTDNAAMSVQPMRLEVLTPPRATNFASFARESRASVEVQVLALINQLDVDAKLEGGTPYKSVSGGVIP